MNEASRLANIQTRSLTKLIETKDSRVKAYVAALMIENDSFLINSSKEDVKEVSEEAYKIKVGLDSKYKDDVVKSRRIFKNYIDGIEAKKDLANKLTDSKRLYSICKKLDVNYGNAFNFFVNKKISSLKASVARDIILEEIKMSV